MLKEKIKILPTTPGCYLMKDINGIIIYVGKAKNLKNRVSSYFNGVHTGKTKILVEHIVDLDFVVTNSEMEALLLEINLIKQHDPKYNVLFRDDKTYPYIELTNEKYPRLVVARNKNKKTTSKLFGPYPNVYAARKTIHMLNRMYPLRKCQIMPKKKCLYYHIGECLGYCEQSISKAVIETMVLEITKFLKGNNDILIKRIKEEMLRFSSNLNFEKAAEMKMLLEDIEKTLKDQVIDLHDQMDRDVFGYAVKDGYISIQALYLRAGKMVKRDSTIYPMVAFESEEFVNYMVSFYQNNMVPKEVFVPDGVDTELLSNVLHTKVLTPKIGKKRDVLEMATHNASTSLEMKIELIKRDEERNGIANDELSKLLHLDVLNRIELFDNSHLFGTFRVSGMVVFEHGEKKKKEYRKYKIVEDIYDDYHLMQEVIRRRYTRVITDHLVMPDLIIVDGGKIQVNAATEVIRQLGLNIPVCGLKKNDKHHTNELYYNNELKNIEKDSNLFHFLERMQDEVHRFTINYHKDIRSKGALESVLDEVAGIGAKRRTELLKTFGSLDNIRKASKEELTKIIPEKHIDLLIKKIEDIK